MIPMFASCTLLWGLMKPHILGVPDEKQAQPQPKKTPDLGIKDKVNIFKVRLNFFIRQQNRKYLRQDFGLEIHSDKAFIIKDTQ